MTTIDEAHARAELLTSAALAEVALGGIAERIERLRVGVRELRRQHPGADAIGHYLYIALDQVDAEAALALEFVRAVRVYLADASDTMPPPPPAAA